MDFSAWILPWTMHGYFIPGLPDIAMLVILVLASYMGNNKALSKLGPPEWMTFKTEFVSSS